jgi:hypothetical protein
MSLDNANRNVVLLNASNLTETLIPSLSVRKPVLCPSVMIIVGRVIVYLFGETLLCDEP